MKKLICSIAVLFPLLAFGANPSFQTVTQIVTATAVKINGGGGTNNSFTNVNVKFPASQGSRMFTAPNWLDDIYFSQPSGVGARWSWVDASNFPIVLIRHDTQYSPPVDAIYFGSTGSGLYQGWPGMNFSISDHTYVPAAQPTLVCDPRFTWIFGEPANYQFRLREGQLTCVPSLQLSIPPKLSSYGLDGDIQLLAHDNATNVWAGEPNWTTTIVGKDIYLTAIPARRFEVLTPTLMTNKTVTITINGTSVVRTCGVDFPVGATALLAARYMATNLATIAGIDAQLDPGSQTNVMIKPLYGVMTLRVARQAGSGLSALNTFASDGGQDGHVYVCALGSAGTNTQILTTNLLVQGDVRSMTNQIWDSQVSDYRLALSDRQDDVLNIGTNWGGVQIHGGVANSGIQVSAGVVAPIGTNNIDLGTATATFRNLYLGGGVTNSSGAGIQFGDTNSALFANCRNGTLWLATNGLGVMYFRSNGAWVVK